MEEKEYLTELFNFSCILRGKVTYIEEVKKRIIKEYVAKGHIKMINPVYDKKGLHILTETEWEEYQMLKKRGAYLVGAGFP